MKPQPKRISLDQRANAIRRANGSPPIVPSKSATPPAASPLPAAIKRLSAATGLDDATLAAAILSNIDKLSGLLSPQMAAARAALTSMGKGPGQPGHVDGMLRALSREARRR